MLPPGNSSGLTTKVSVEIAISPPPTRHHRGVAELAQDRVAEVGQEALREQRGAQLAAGAVARAGPGRVGDERHRADQAGVSRARSVISRLRGRGCAEAAVVVVGGAGALRRDHRRAERVLRRAARAEGGTLDAA